MFVVFVVVSVAPAAGVVKVALGDPRITREPAPAVIVPPALVRLTVQE